jgi:predicted tellurium resistance membrane protein TerC
MRLVVGQLIALIERYPALVNGAFIIIAWVGIKLIAEYLHTAAYTDLAIPQWLSLGLIGLIFLASFLYARRHEKQKLTKTEKATQQLYDEEAR